MMNLAEYRRTATRLADFLPWAALVGEGVVLNKDGSFQRTARFRGPDLDSAVAAELVAVASRLNNAFRRLGSGWAIFVEAQRHEAASYPASRFADAASALVDAERKADFEEADAHYESSYFLTFLYLPPAEDAARAETWLYEGRQQSGVDPHEALAAFIDRTNRVLQLVDGFMPECRWLDDAETLTYLHSTVSTKRHRVRVPETPVYLDALLADEPLTGGLEPRLSTLNLAHMIPLSAVWAGPERDEHFGAPPLLYGKTEGSTPFRFSLHVGDVGHTLVVGPTGAGKSVLLALIALQFRRYPGSQVFAFDFGGSIRAAALAMGGDWHDLGGSLTDGAASSVSVSSPMHDRAGRTRSAAFRTRCACRPVSSAISTPTAPRWRVWSGRARVRPARFRQPRPATSCSHCRRSNSQTWSLWSLRTAERRRLSMPSEPQPPNKAVNSAAGS